jgi:hypothetical protein
MVDERVADGDADARRVLQCGIRLGGGAFGPATMFRLPGYVGGEESQPVPRAVVAVMPAGRMRPAWGVDFWIDDVGARSTTYGDSAGARGAVRRATRRSGRGRSGGQSQPEPAGDILGRSARDRRRYLDTRAQVGGGLRASCV